MSKPFVVPWSGDIWSSSSNTVKFYFNSVNENQKLDNVRGVSACTSFNFKITFSFNSLILQTFNEINKRFPNFWLFLYNFKYKDHLKHTLFAISPSRKAFPCLASVKRIDNVKISLLIEKALRKSSKFVRGGGIIFRNQMKGSRVKKGCKPLR